MKLRGLAQPVGLLALCCALCVGYYVRCVGNLTQPAALESAQVARNVAEGKGFTTRCLRPWDLQSESDVSRVHAASVSPLPALATALAFRLGGVSDRVAGLASGLLLLPTLALLFLLGRELGGNTVGGLAALLYASSGAALAEAFAGTSTQAAAFLLLGWTYVAVRGVASLEAQSSGSTEDTTKSNDCRWSAARLLAAGVVFGLVMLTDWHLAVLWPLALVLAVRGSEDWSLLRAGSLVLVGGLVVVGPWMVHNFRVTGSPVSAHCRYLAVDTSAYPGTTLERTVSASVPARGPLVARKAVNRLLRLRDEFGRWAEPYLLAVFAMALFAVTPTEAGSVIRAVLVWLMLPRAVVGCFFDLPAGGFLPFLPLATVLAADLLVRYGRQAANDLEAGVAARRRRAAAPATAVVALTLIPTLGQFLHGVPFHNPAAELKDLPVQVKPGEVLVSDAPWSVAWYTNHTALWAPLTEDDLEKLQNQVVPIAGIVLTPGTQANVGEPFPDSVPWEAFRQRPGFVKGFRPAVRLEDGTVAYGPVERETD